MDTAKPSAGHANKAFTALSACPANGFAVSRYNFLKPS